MHFHPISRFETQPEQKLMMTRAAAPSPRGLNLIVPHNSAPDEGAAAHGTDTQPRRMRSLPVGTVQRAGSIVHKARKGRQARQDVFHRFRGAWLGAGLQAFVVSLPGFVGF
jgi:hypothetical protein